MLLVETYITKSNRHGNGLFAKKFIGKGSVIWDYTPGIDVSIGEKEFDSLNSLSRRYFLKYAYKDGDQFVLCSDDAKYMNHDNEPNTENNLNPFSKQTLASRDIFPDEEITCNYNDIDDDGVDKFLKVDK